MASVPRDQEAEAPSRTDVPFRVALRPQFIVAVLVLLIGSYLLLRTRGAGAIGVVVPLWLLSLPLVVRPASSVRSEALGLLFLFYMTTNTALIAVFFGASSSGEVSAPHDAKPLVVLSWAVAAAYLVHRRDTLAQVLRQPVVWLFGLFLLQQIVSAVAFSDPELSRTVTYRVNVMLTVLVSATLARRPGSECLISAVITVAILASVPVAMCEVLHPEILRMIPGERPELDGVIRAGGLYFQPNNAGALFGLGVAFVLLLAMSKDIPKLAAVLLASVMVVGVLCTASRGALLTVVVLFAFAPLLRIRGPLLAVGVALLGLFLITLTVSDVTSWVDALNDRLVSAGFTPASRLHDAVVDVAQSRTANVTADRDLLRVDAMRLIARQPIFGYGTGVFVTSVGVRSHIMFLDILGQNGIVGGIFYAVFLIALASCVRRIPPHLRAGSILVGISWLIAHLDNHNIMEFGFLILPAGFLSGVASLNAPAMQRADVQRLATAGSQAKGTVGPIATESRAG